MPDPFLARLRQHDLPADDIDLMSSHYGGSRSVTARVDIAGPCEAAGVLHILLEGWACKYRLMSDGRRQIISFLLPGDVCDIDRLFDAGTSIGVNALTDCRVATVSAERLVEARAARPTIGAFLWSLVCREHAAMSEQIVALGRRTSRQRIAYLLCDLLIRLQALGLAEDGRFRSPLTQTDIADALGLSTVHVNRTLQGLREDGLIEMRGRSLRVPRKSALQAAADYDGGVANVMRTA